MSWTGSIKTKTMKALSSMAGMQYRIVELATSEPNACDYAAAQGGYGVLLNEPGANEAATVVTEGEIPCKAALAISIGDWITTAASAAGGPGWATKVVSGDAFSAGFILLGRALSSAASGSVFTLDLDPQKRVQVSSAGLVVL